MMRGLLTWEEYPTLAYLAESYLGNWFFVLGLTNIVLWLLIAAHLIMSKPISIFGKSVWFVFFIVGAFIFNFIYWYVYIVDKSITSNSSGRQKAPPLT